MASFMSFGRGTAGWCCDTFSAGCAIRRSAGERCRRLSRICRPVLRADTSTQRDCQTAWRSSLHPQHLARPASRVTRPRVKLPPSSAIRRAGRGRSVMPIFTSRMLRRHSPARQTCRSRTERTPRLYALLGKAFVDVGLSTYRAKTHYQRVRPFAMHNGSTCTPDDEEMLRKDGSYPSGHSAVGWGWALILTEVFPDHADAILQRGWAFGESRVVCNVHWQSDVDAGRVMAGATVARLHAVPAFETDLEAAKAEVAIVRAEGAMPVAEACADEAASLRLGP